MVETFGPFSKPKMKKVKDFYVVRNIRGDDLFIMDKKEANRVYKANLRLFSKKVKRLI